MKKFRLLSAFLTVVMVAGSLSAFSLSAADTKTDEPLVPGINEETGEPTISYLTEKFATPEDKLATMTKYLEKGNFELYVEPVSGEVAYRNAKTGQIIFSNPWDIADDSTKASASIKQELMSQIVIKYTDNDADITINSFVEACQRGQINVKKIKNGVRVEYTMGREETRKLVPKQIERSRFEELIMANIPDGTPKSKMEAFYTLKNPFDPDLTERGRNELIGTFPVCETMAIYVFDPYASDRELNLIEGYIKLYCPEYTYETLEEDHAMTEYEGTDKAPVLFRLSLEYTLDDDGNLDVRLPANGIRYDESAFQLTEIRPLPYFGAGSNDFEGYTFFPDGSGAIVRFEDIENKPLILTGKIYGEDYAYQKVSNAHKDIMRMPVYGVVETNVVNEKTVTTTDDDGNKTTKTSIRKITTKDGEPYDKKTVGFLAIIEEGDALASITTNSGGLIHKYNNVYTAFSPRPKDSYNLAEAISVGQNATYTVVSKRKYAGSYRIKFIMLTDDELAKESGLTKYYEASYVGMAKAYREYLEKEGKLADLTDIKDQLPLYIESFGCIEDVERILSIPVDVLKPLTTFDDLKEMYGKLEEAGISNVRFKLTGFANDGMNDTSAYSVKFEKTVGGNDGFTDFVEFASSKGVSVYPDFDFANIGNFKMFDGVSMRRHLIKTMDNRYTSKRYYDSTLQSYQRGYSLAVSPSVYSYFYEHFTKDYSKLNPTGISVATLGTDLNSDFDKKEPYNREDNKGYTTDLLAKIKEDYKNVMIDGGNVYSLEYASDIINVSLDSSRFSGASESVPFVGMVLHGSMNFAGTAINMAGDTNYELLKAIENGASLYFTLSAQNTQLLKEDIEFQKYYSVNFDIWYDSVTRLYSELNDAIGNLQTKKITDHQFLIGERVPSAEEIEADKIAEAEALEKEQEEEALLAEKEERKKNLEERLAALAAAENPEEADTTETVVDDTTETDDETVDETVEEVETYKKTKYTSDDGKIVKVTYEGGTSFILNYNNFEITVVDGGKTYTIGALGYVKIK